MKFVAHIVINGSPVLIEVSDFFTKGEPEKVSQLIDWISEQTKAPRNLIVFTGIEMIFLSKFEVKS